MTKITDEAFPYPRFYLGQKGKRLELPTIKSGIAIPCGEAYEVRAPGGHPLRCQPLSHTAPRQWSRKYLLTSTYRASDRSINHSSVFASEQALIDAGYRLAVDYD